MSKAIVFTIRESIPEIKKLIKSYEPFLAQRLKVLFECKKNEETGISLRDLAKHTGYCQASVHSWRSLYINGGLDMLLTHERKCNKPTSFSPHEHDMLNDKLRNSENGLIGYKELQRWIESEMGKVVKYKTVYSYTRKNFGTKIKVARKSHVKKDNDAVEVFKKSSVKSVPRQ
jgi:transposase